MQIQNGTVIRSLRRPSHVTIPKGTRNSELLVLEINKTKYICMYIHTEVYDWIFLYEATVENGVVDK